MPRIGKFTDTVYEDDFDFSKCPECCTVVSTEQIKDKSFRALMKVKNTLDCINCAGCPASKG